MSSIGFFTPIIYHTPNKTIAQRALEIVDEYFYLGGKFRVSLFKIAPHDRKFVGQNNLQDRQRSWLNLALKIASYMTLILPLFGLAIKAFLRFYLKISSIQMQPGSWEGSRWENQIPPEIWPRILIGLPCQDQNRFALVANFARDAVRSTQKPYIESMRSLKAEMQAFPNSIKLGEIEQILIKLATFPHHDHSDKVSPISETVWNSAIHKLMLHRPRSKMSIQDHINLADRLVKLQTPLTSCQIYRFFRCIGLLLSESRFSPYLAYRSFGKYLLKSEQDFSMKTKALKEHLLLEANRLIKGECNYKLQELYKYQPGLPIQLLQFQEIDIDPREWFGRNGDQNSLWNLPDSTVPESLIDVIMIRIQELRDACPDRPTIVMIDGRSGCYPPAEFLVPLAEKIMEAEVFIQGNRINTDLLRPSKYKHTFIQLTKGEKHDIIELDSQTFTIDK